jgi:hypothetical protein
MVAAPIVVDRIQQRRAAHCARRPNVEIAGVRTAPDGIGLPPMDKCPGAKLSNFEQRSQCISALLAITGGLRCPDLIQRHQALLSLVALCYPSRPHSLTFPK